MERSLENSQLVADKMTPIFDLIKELTEDEIEYLKETALTIEEENSTRMAVAGTLIPLEKAEVMNELGGQAMERITGIILIWSAIQEQPKIMRRYMEKAREARAIEQMFGL